MNEAIHGNAATGRAPEVDLLVAILAQALEDAAGGVDKGRSGHVQDQSHAELFVFDRNGEWAESRRLILATLDIEEGYFDRLAHKYVDGRRNGTLAATRINRGGRPCAADRTLRRIAPLALPPLRPARPAVAETFPDLPPADQPVAVRVLAAFRAAVPLAVNVKHLCEALAPNEKTVRSAITRLNNKGHRLRSLGNSIFALDH